MKDELLKVEDGDPLTEQEIRNVLCLKGKVPNMIKVEAGRWQRNGNLWEFHDHPNRMRRGAT